VTGSLHRARAARLGTTVGSLFQVGRAMPTLPPWGINLGNLPNLFLLANSLPTIISCRISRR
jgi:hypothetical protein